MLLTLESFNAYDDIEKTSFHIGVSNGDVSRRFLVSCWEACDNIDMHGFHIVKSDRDMTQSYRGHIPVAYDDMETRLNLYHPCSRTIFSFEKKPKNFRIPTFKGAYCDFNINKDLCFLIGGGS